LGGGGYGATSVALADIDGDGKLDIVVAAGCPGGGCVGVLLGNGDGTFQTELTPNRSAGFAALSVAVGDVNGDGHPDVVVANQCTDNTCTSSTVGVLLGKGDGTFQPVVPYGPGGIFTDWIVIADVNGDSKPDIVVANSSTSLKIGQGNVGVLLGNGDGTFQTAVAYPSGAFGAAAVAVADVNGDGKPDVVVVNCSSTSGSCVPAGGNVGVLLGKGNGSFQKAVTFGAGGNAPFALAVGDLNGDKKPDIVSANCISGNCGAGAGTVGVLINTSTKGEPAVTFSPISLTFPAQLVSSTSKAQPVKLTNTGTAILLITKISVTGPFSQTNQCPSSLKPNASCTINVEFQPKTKGVLHGSVNVTDNAAGSPQKVPLTGTGTYVQLVPVKVNFGNQPVGTKSPPRKVALTNRGQQTLNITSITIKGTDGGDFAETNNCGKQVAPGASCSIQVNFKPTKKGSRTANVSISDDGGASPQKVALLGAGT
jgi:archaellum component FlaF (FlaF/FlaG flagellin family)